MKRSLLIIAVLAIALPLHAQSGCSDSPEAPTAILALVGSLGIWLSWRLFGKLTNLQAGQQLALKAPGEVEECRS